MKKRILSLLVDRANYGRMKPVLEHLNANEEVDLEIMISGTMSLSRFGNAEQLVIDDKFKITSRIFMELEGGLPISMTKSLGYSISEYASELSRLRPDFLLVIGDRFEALGAVIAASYLNICVIHIQGGEVSGSIDESARHAITKFSHYHFPATNRSAQYVIKMGEKPSTVFNFGCPSADVAAKTSSILDSQVFDHGVGAKIDPSKPYYLVVFHPVTTEYERSAEAVKNLLSVLIELRHPTIWLWPNIDAGTDLISKELRKYREIEENNWLRLFKNFPPEIYLNILKNSKCALGNSSSFVRDSSFLGTPVVLIGKRQVGREYAENVIISDDTSEQIRMNLFQAIKKGVSNISNLYGEAGSSKKISDKISQLEPYHQKILNYIYE
jgi:UDP-hydrolysing UDP-N-acetyl-D-glucosamine 2-epimerase